MTSVTIKINQIYKDTSFGLIQERKYDTLIEQLEKTVVAKS
jgi:hypothetical protein